LFCFLILLKPQVLGNYLVVQWLGFQASTAAGTVGHDSWSGEQEPTRHSQKQNKTKHIKKNKQTVQESTSGFKNA